MKKAGFFIAAAILVMSLCGCRKEVAKTPELDSLFRCEASFSCGDFKGSATLNRLGNDMWDVEFTEPVTLDGVKLSFNHEEITASYLGLSFSVPKEAAPVKSGLLMLFKAIDDTAAATEMPSERGETETIYHGENEYGKYEITLNNETRALVKFEMPSEDCVIEFENYAPIT